MLVTYTGKYFDYNNITKESIDINDIIHALTGINRFGGHSSRAYSVAEHTLMCLFVAETLGYSTREKFLVFIHDFTEAYVNDCPSPLKVLLTKFIEIEAEVETAIYDYLNIEPPTEKEYEKIKSIDLTMLAIEMRDLTLHQYENFIYDGITHLNALNTFNLSQAPTLSREELKEQLHYHFNNLMNELDVENNEGKNKYQIYASLKDANFSHQEELWFSTDEEAHDYAYSYACDLYDYHLPECVTEMMERNINEDEAFKLYEESKNKSIVYEFKRV